MKEYEDFKKQSYFRLLKYSGKYKIRLIIGILAGFVVGGSLFGSFMMLPQLISGFQGQIKRSEKEIDKKTLVVLKVLKSSAFNSEEERKEALKKVLISGDDEKKKLSAKVESIRKKAAQWGMDLPIFYKNGLVVFNSEYLHFSLPAEDKYGHMTWQFFALFVFGFIGMWTLKNFATYINRYFMRWVGTRVVADLRDEVFNKLLNQSLKFYGGMDVGKLISRCTNDTASIESAVANTIADATRCPIEVLACASAIIIASIKNNNFVLLLILGIGLPLCVLPVILVGKRIRKRYKKAYSKIADVVSRMHEVFTGIIIIKAFHAEAKEQKRFQSVNAKYFHTLIKALRAELLMAPLMETVAVASTLVFLVYTFRQKVSIEELAQLLIPAFMAYQPIKRLAKVSTYIQRSMAAADRYFNLIDTEFSVKESANPIQVNDFKDKIVFNHVAFSYTRGHKILHDINFTMKKGSVIAVVGETGSGKSTIAHLIARFYDPDSGVITLDGIDLKDMEIASLRDMIGIVTQDPILFNDTIANNIAYGRENISMEEIIEAAKQANAHRFITDGRHPDGYDTVVGEKGFKLSGGEKQRIAIARAILKNPPILILDEATSALDTVTEKLIQDALNKVMKNRTVFAIAHRLSTVQKADMILVLDKGRIIEKGTHSELLRQAGKYKQLHDTQFENHSDNRSDCKREK